MRLLLVEDARLIREPLSRALELTGWKVEAVPDGEAALARLAAAPVDAVVLDVMLPGKDGLSVLSELRARGDATPVILLTARGDVRDRVRGLDLGADDYLAKPFHVEELLARLRAVLRSRGITDPSTVIEAFGMLYAPDSRELKYGGESCVLTPKEGLVLEALMRHAGTPVHRGRIVTAAWGAEGESSSGRLETQVSLLRSKIAVLEAPVSIHAIRGIGYVLEAKHEDAWGPRGVSPTHRRGFRHPRRSVYRSMHDAARGAAYQCGYDGAQAHARGALKPAV